MQSIKNFFIEIDQHWAQVVPGKIKLSIIGCGALVLQTTYERGTKDSDVFETMSLTPETKRQLLDLAGPGTELHKRRKLYVDIVSNGVPFLAHVPAWRPVPELVLQNFELQVTQ